MKALESKIPPPLVGICIGVIMWWVSNVTPVYQVNGTIKLSLVGSFIAIGLFFDLAGVISFRIAKTTVNPLKPYAASSLVTSGIYQYTRNPMYVGFVFILLGWASFLASPWSVLLIGGFIAYIQRFQITPEERALTVLFEQEFILYKSQVRAWL